MSIDMNLILGFQKRSSIRREITHAENSKRNKTCVNHKRGISNQMTSRTSYTLKNVAWGNISHILNLIIKFISRTVFIHYLGQTYMGVSGLYTNILGVLSFTELGLGTAMNYALYKPVADGDQEKVKSLMLFYKTAYRVIAAVIGLLGLAIIPFLQYIVKDPGNVGNIYVYYLIFLFDTVTSYLVSYKFSLVSAEQKSYIMTNINMVISLVQTLIQILIIIIYRNFLLYLLGSSAIALISKFYIVWFFNKHYAYLNEHPKKIKKTELDLIKKNVGALIVHKIGDVCVHQTDNILISAFVSLEIVGKISNYNYVIMTVTGFLSVLLNAVIGSLGNLIASEPIDHQYRVFKTYRFVGYWLYGFCAVAYYILFQPFITIWAGPEWIVDDLTIALICLERYNIGHRVVVNNFKSAAGLFNQDKWCAFGQALVNLVVSVVMVKLIGLPGIYMGTVIQGLLATAVKPYVLYKYGFQRNVVSYYIDSVKYLGVELVIAACMMGLKHLILPDLSMVSTGRFVILIIATAVVPNLFYILAFYKTDEFKYIYEQIGSRVVSKVKRIIS